MIRALLDLSSEYLWRACHPGRRYGDWMPTYTGQTFWPLDARPFEVRVRDIAHALSQIPRFGGHLSRPYTVGQHSIHCALQARELARCCFTERQAAVAGLYGLLHDGAEAYLLDLIRPLKRLPAFRPYCRYERRLQGVVYTAFDLYPAIAPDRELVALVKQVDNQMLATEVWQLMPAYAERHRERWVVPDPYDFKIPEWTVNSWVEGKFLDLYRELATASGHLPTRQQWWAQDVPCF